MDEVSVLCVLGVVLVVVTFVGHGIWLVVAALLRAMFRDSHVVESDQRHCHACGHPFGMVDGRCQFCGVWAEVESRPGLRQDLLATSRQLDRWLQDGTIDQERHDELVGLLQTDFRSPEGQPKPLPEQADEITAPASFAARVSKDGGVSESAEYVDETAEVVDAEMVVDDESLVEPVQNQPTEELPSEPSTPSRTLADVLQSFMEEKNIRWGELISGLLIVVSAIGLVLSLRHTIVALSEEIPYFPAFLFLLGTAAFHGAANYTLRSWNLQRTSRGALVIGLLLIPLNFLAAILLSGSGEKQLPVFHWIYLLAATVGLASYGAMAYFAGRALMRKAWHWLLLVVMGTCFGQMLINRLTGSQTSWLSANALLLLPLACFVSATIGQAWQASKWRRVSMRRAFQVFLLLGVAAFSFSVPLGLLLSKTDSIRATLAHLSPALSLVAAMILVTGLIVHQRSLHSALSRIRTAGTTLALLGGALMLGMVILAWPRPGMLIALAMVNFGLLTFLAVGFRLPQLHALAIGCLTFATVVAGHFALGYFDIESANLSQRLFETLTLGRTSVMLLLVSIAVVGGAVAWHRNRRGGEAVVYAGTSAIISVVAILISLGVGFLAGVGHDVAMTTLVLLFYAVALLVAGAVLRLPLTSWCGSGLLLAALVHTFAWNEWVQSVVALHRPVLVGTIAHAALTTLTAVVVHYRRIQTGEHASLHDCFITPLCWSALFSSVLATPSAILVQDARYSDGAFYAMCVAAVWLGVALVQRLPAVFAMFQAIATLAVSFVVCAIGLNIQWWNGRMLDLKFIPVQIGVLAVWCLAWSIFRKSIGDRENVRDLLDLPLPTVDEILLGGLVASVVGLGLYGCAPGVANELGKTTASSADEVPHELAYGWPVWVAWGTVAAALCSTLWRRLTTIGICGAIVLGGAVPLLFAGLFDDTVSVATAARWDFSVYGFVVAMFMCARSNIMSLVRRAEWLGWDQVPATAASASRETLLVIVGLPVIAITLSAAMQTAAGKSLGGPIEGSFFADMGLAVSYAVPLFLYTASLVVFAVRERSARYMLCGSFVFQFTIILAIVLQRLLSGYKFDDVAAISLLQWSAIGLGAYSLLWLCLRRWIEPQRALDSGESSIVEGAGSTISAPVLLIGQLLVTSLVTLLLPLLTTWFVFIVPDHIPRWITLLGDIKSYIALLAGCLAVTWFSKSQLATVGINLLGVIGLALCGLVSATCLHQYLASGWLAYHVLMSGWLVIAISATATCCWATLNRQTVANHDVEHSVWRRMLFDSTDDLDVWANFVAGGAVLFALRSSFVDPNVQWPVVTLGVTTVLAITLGVASLRQVYAYVSVALAFWATTILWLNSSSGGMQSVLTMVHANLVIVMLVAGIWLAAEIRRQFVFADSFSLHSHLPLMHRVATIGVTAFALGTTFLVFFSTSIISRSARLDASSMTGAVMLVALGSLLFTSFWDRRANYLVACIYAWTFISLFLILDQMDDVTRSMASLQGRLSPRSTLCATCLAVASLVALSGHLWKRGLNIARLGNRFAIPQTVRGLERTARWLPITNSLLAGLVVVVATSVVLTSDERTIRMCAAFAPLLLAYGLAMLAQEARRLTMQYATLAMGAVTIVLLHWADLQSSVMSSVILEHTVRLLIALSVTAAVYAFAVYRLQEEGHEWLKAFRSAMATSAILAVVALVAVFLLELAYFDSTHGVPFSHPYQVVVVILVLIGLIAALLMLALMKGRDPLGLSDAERVYYVYGAEAVAALLFAHLYLAWPMLFSGAVRQWWPYIVMAIAFAGVGAGELFKRYGLQVMAEPFQRTAAFLPLLPALAFWIIGDKNDLSFEQLGLSYPMVMVVVGLMYIVLSVLRRSMASGLAAAIAGNVALLVFYQDFSWALLEHPQFWIIPPALSVLVGAHINRERLGENALTGVRYAVVSVIYLSSTVEMIIESASHSLWPPMVLAGLALVGAFAGMILQVRAFLYLGSAFVLLALVSMVWHAARAIQHVWPWWAFGMGVGLMILLLFGMFEMKREEVTRLIERLRKWES